MAFPGLRKTAVAVAAAGGLLALASPIAGAGTKAPAKVTICHFENTNHVGDGRIGVGQTYVDAAACTAAGGAVQTVAAKALKGHRLV